MIFVTLSYSKLFNHKFDHYRYIDIDNHNFSRYLTSSNCNWIDVSIIENSIISKILNYRYYPNSISYPKLFNCKFDHYRLTISIMIFKIIQFDINRYTILIATSYISNSIILKISSHFHPLYRIVDNRSSNRKLNHQENINISISLITI